MLPHFHSHPNNSSNQLNLNGASASAPQQVVGSQGNSGPSQMQIRPQFQVGLLNSPQLAMPPFTIPNAYFAPTKFFPFLQGSWQTVNTSNLVHNAVNPPQFLPNGQLNVPNLVQNVDKLLQMPMANYEPQNLVPFVNTLMDLANGNGVVPQSGDGSGLKHLNHNAAAIHNFGSPQTQRSQSNARIVSGDNDIKDSWRKSQNKNFIRNHKHDESQRGKFSQKQYHHRPNAQGKFKLTDESGGNGQGKGNKNNGVKSFNLPNPSEQIQVGKKRSFALIYPEQDIQQWREARRKNYPSKANMEKKLKENLTQPEVMVSVAKMRREQLKEILVKQAELGCEVAELPSYYLSDSELRTDGRQHNSKELRKREKFCNKFDKKSKFHQFDRFSKRQRLENRGSANLQNRSDCFTKKQIWPFGCTTDRRTHNIREPSLLKKLLSSDIKRDKRRLLQVFRFMVINSFFENCPEKSLKFPVVIVEELGDGSGIIEEEPKVVKGDR